MKHIFVLLFSSCFLCSSSLAQLLIIRGGAGCANLFGGSYGDPLAAQVSIEARILELNERSGITGGLGYSLQGGSYSDPDFKGKVVLSYITAPILYMHTLNNGIYGEIGLAPGFLISARDKGTNLNQGGGSYDDDFKEFVNKFDLGIPVGAGYRLKNGLGVGARLTYGLLKVDKDVDEATHNFSIVGTISYQLNFGAKKSKQ